MTAFVICVGSSLLSITVDVTLQLIMETYSSRPKLLLSDSGNKAKQS